MWPTLRALINPYCHLCGELRSFVCDKLPLCQGCHEDLPWIDARCFCCGLPLERDATECGECLQTRPHFNQAAIPWSYEFPVANLITGFKHQQRHDHGALLADLMGDFLLRHYYRMPWPQVLIPVPLHHSRRQQRGFNQALEIAQRLGRYLHLPVLDDLLVRNRDTGSQQGLDRKQRQANLRDAFCCSGNTGFKRVAIIDDVVTTGSTVNSIALELQKQGIEDIHVWALARTPKN